jgi:hypothetical protein
MTWFMADSNRCVASALCQMFFSSLIFFNLVTPKDISHGAIALYNTMALRIGYIDSPPLKKKKFLHFKKVI